MVVQDREELKRQVRLIRRRVQHGYRLAQRLEAPSIQVLAARRGRTEGSSRGPASPLSCRSAIPAHRSTVSVGLEWLPWYL